MSLYRILMACFSQPGFIFLSFSGGSFIAMQINVYVREYIYIMSDNV